jgi:ABC-type multidrug transport system ATPase subunit
VTRTFIGLDRPVLDDVELRLDPGTVTRLEGANGAGKTTLLRVAGGLLRADTGRVALGPYDPESTRQEFHRRVALLTATQAGLYARLRVRAHVDWWARVSRLDRRVRDGLVAEALEAFALTDLAGRRVDRLSAGQRQRVRLAMVFLPRPDVVLLDEPRNSLDAEGAGLLATAIEQLAARGGAALYAAPEGEVDPLHPHAVIRLADGRLSA